MSQGAVNDYGEAWNAGQQIWNTTVANVSHGAKVLWRSASRNNQVYRCQKKRRETIRFIICFQITPVTAKTMLVVEAGELRHFLPASERRSSLQAVSPAHSECTR